MKTISAFWTGMVAEWVIIGGWMAFTWNEDKFWVPGLICIVLSSGAGWWAGYNERPIV